jgi:ABC-type dipeptide/oligopeptide/nickel transport system permease subunit
MQSSLKLGSFLGLDTVPLTASLGLMLQEARAYIRTDARFGIRHGVTFVAMVLALNAMADAIVQRANPRSGARRVRQSGL